jgi:lysophospholipase L1-like esterase
MSKIISKVLNKNALQKILLILFGCIISLFLIEVTLRLSGHFFYKLRMKSERDSIQREKEKFACIVAKQMVAPEELGLFKILCVGDSFIFGVGAEPGYSYPAQLQKILYAEHLERSKVYNCGIPGCTSTKLLSYLPGFLEEYKPDMIIILVGSNDIDNPYISDLVLLSPGFGKYYYNFRSFINDLRVYKVLRFGFKELTRKIRIPKKHTLHLRKNINSESEKYAQMGVDFYHQGKIELAKDYYKKAMDSDPNNEIPYLLLGQLYSSQEQFDKAIILFEDFLKINPYSDRREEVYRHLFWIYQQENSPRDRIQVIMQEIHSDDKFENPGTPFILTQKKVIENFEYNLQKMNALAKSKKIKLIFQTYPRDPRRFNINSSIRKLAVKYNIALIDNEEEFRTLPNIADYFTADGHPNKNGYSIMAKKVYEILCKI